MDDPRWLRLIVVGLVLAALVAGYMILSGGFVKSKPAQKSNQAVTEKAVRSPDPSVIPIATGSAYGQLSDRSQSNVQRLPNTGPQLGLILLVSLSIMFSGWSLRKFSR